MTDVSPPLRLPRTVLIGAVARNRGKTEFACEVVRELAAGHRVHAAKITTIRNGEVACIHGDASCGVCDAMSGNCVVTEELKRDGSKDTSRMLAAGAERVWWIRVREHCLDEAAAKLPGLVPEDGVLVLESNSIRKAVHPDLFLMLGRMDDPLVKDSARDLIHEVDRFVAYDGSEFDLRPAAITLRDGRPGIPMEAAAIVLAGGKSTRMGTDKRLLPVEGVPLVTRACGRLGGCVQQVLLSVDRGDSVGASGAVVVTDGYPGTGPMGGVLSALEVSHHDINLVVACDIPNIDLDFVQELLRRARNHDVVVPVDSSKRYEPLFAVYSRRVIPILREMLEAGERRIRMLYDRVDTLAIPIPPGVDLRSLNTREDYQAFMAG